MREHLDTTIDALTTLRDNVDSLADVEDRLADASAQLEATTKAHAKVQAALTSDAALLDKARLDAATKHDTEMFEKTKALRQLTAQVAAKQAEVDDLTVKVNDLHAHHDQILASLESLRKQLR